MKINDIKSTKIKKVFDAKSVHFRWHNKNKSGGNFGINILNVNGIDYQITGDYTKDGEVTDLRFGLIYQAGIPFFVKTFEEMLVFMDNCIQKKV